jgi:hypothetical protein
MGDQPVIISIMIQKLANNLRCVLCAVVVPCVPTPSPQLTHMQFLWQRTNMGEPSWHDAGGRLSPYWCCQESLTLLCPPAFVSTHHLPFPQILGQ